MLWTTLTFGVEIECYVPYGVDLNDALRSAGLQVSHATRTHQTVPGWKVVPDASLERDVPTGYIGREVVSPVLSGEAGIDQVRRAADAVKAAGCIVNKNCGLHVHIGAASMSADQLKNLAKLFVRYEHHFDVVCPMSRRNNRFAQSNLKLAAGGARGAHQAEIIAACVRIDGARSVRAVAEVMNGGYNQVSHYNQFRYYKLNFQSLAPHGTVEYRQQAGSVEAQKICNWIKTVAQFSAHAFSLRTVAPTAEVPSFEKFLRKVERTVAAFLGDRRARLNGGTVAARSRAAAPARDVF